MDALDVVMVCLRRWWVMLPVLALAAAVGMNMTQQQKPVYVASGGYALVYAARDAVLADNSGQDPLRHNPLAANNGALIGEALMADLMSQKSQLELGGNGNSGTGPGEAAGGSNYTVLIPTPGMSTYTVKTWGETEAGARATVAGVLASTAAKAAELQKRAGAPEQYQYTAFVAVPTEVTEVPAQSGAKMLLAISAVGLMAGAAFSLVVDRTIKRRKETSRRRKEAVTANPLTEGTTRRSRRTANGTPRRPFSLNGRSVAPKAHPSQGAALADGAEDGQEQTSPSIGALSPEADSAPPLQTRTNNGVLNGRHNNGPVASQGENSVGEPRSEAADVVLVVSE